MEFVIGGQLNKDEIEKTLITLTVGHDVSIQIKSDLEAAMMMKQGAADYYIGACNTGAGGALAMAIALLGADKCATIGMPGKVLDKDEIEAIVDKGILAFGFTAQDVDVVLPFLIPALIARHT